MDQVLGITQTQGQARFRDLYQTTLPIVYGFLALRVGGDRALAEDLTAETFAAAVRHYRAGRAEEVTVSWLRTVARRRLVDHWRRRAVASANVVALARPAAGHAETNPEERHMVSKVLASLADEQRSVLILHHVEGYSVADVSKIINRTPKATESLLSRSRAAFRREYTEMSDD